MAQVLYAAIGIAHAEAVPTERVEGLAEQVKHDIIVGRLDPHPPANGAVGLREVLGALCLAGFLGSLPRSYAAPTVRLFVPGSVMAAKTEPADADERAVLLGWLAFHRTTLAERCAGLTDEQLIQASAPPSDLTLLGLVRHLTIMERVYLSHPLGGAPFDLIYCSDANPQGDVAGLVPGDVGPSIAAWQTEQRRVDELITGMPSLDQIASNGGESMHWLVVKMVQEYARHNGHADPIRERIDGETGE